MVAGWVPFTFQSRDGDAVECRVLKVRAGKTFFGASKNTFRVFKGLETGRFIFISEHSTTLKAMWGVFKLMTEMGVRGG